VCVHVAVSALAIELNKSQMRKAERQKSTIGIPTLVFQLTVVNRDKNHNKYAKSEKGNS
jgi:hypothetical protein